MDFRCKNIRRKDNFYRLLLILPILMLLEKGILLYWWGKVHITDEKNDSQSLSQQRQLHLVCFRWYSPSNICGFTEVNLVNNQGEYSWNLIRWEEIYMLLSPQLRFRYLIGYLHSNRVELPLMLGFKALSQTWT